MGSIASLLAAALAWIVGLLAIANDWVRDVLDTLYAANRILATTGAAIRARDNAGRHGPRA
jgi:hypothetical protein